MSHVKEEKEPDDVWLPEQIGLSSERLGEAYGLLERAVAEGHLMGAAIQVSRKGMALEPRCFGRREIDPDGAPSKPDTIFLVASVTKPVTTTAAMLLVERGKLHLDEPVASLVPEFAQKGKEGVLLRHLFTHTSGLPDMLPENQQLRAIHAPLEEFIRRICEEELLFPPGTYVSYQSCGLAMLAEIVERVEGIPFRKFLRYEIFDPLGMDDTSLGTQKDKLHRISQVRIPGGNFQYGSSDRDWNWNSSYWWNFGAPWGGLFSTVEDMTLFCQMFLNGGRHRGIQILSPMTIASMTTNRINPMPHIPQQVKLLNRWGLGWRLADLGSSRLGDLLSIDAFGHTGATGTLVWIDPRLQMTCVLFTNDPQGAVRLRTLVSNGVVGSVTDFDI